MKKFLCFMILIAVVLAAPMMALAVEPFDGSNIKSTGVILLEANTGQVLFEKDPEERVYPASTTKLLTALTVMDQITSEAQLDEKITIAPESVNFNSSSSKMGLIAGETLSIRDLLYGLMLPSGNDAALALAIHFGGSEDGFAVMMNQKAQQIGMSNSNFINPHGLFISQKGPNHYTTARDMSKLAMEYYKNDFLMGISGTQSYTVPANNKHEEPYVIQNGNFLINTPPTKPEYSSYLYEGATGMKTGLAVNLYFDDDTVIKSNGCLVASAERNGLPLIAVIFGDPSEGGVDRWPLIRNLLDYGFNNYAMVDLTQYVQPVTLSEAVTGFAENDPDQGTLPVHCTVDPTQLGTQPQLTEKAIADGLADGSTQVTTEVNYTKPLVAPIAKDEEIGTVTYKLGDRELYTTSLVADRTVYALGDEKQVSEEYDVPMPSVFDSLGDGELPIPLWAIIAIIGGAAVAIFFILRMTRRGGRGGFEEPVYQARGGYGGNGGRRRDEQPLRQKKYAEVEAQPVANQGRRTYAPSNLPHQGTRASDGQRNRYAAQSGRREMETRTQRPNGQSPQRGAAQTRERRYAQESAWQVQDERYESQGANQRYVEQDATRQPRRNHEMQREQQPYRRERAGYAQRGYDEHQMSAQAAFEARRRQEVQESPQGQQHEQQSYARRAHQAQSRSSGYRRLGDDLLPKGKGRTIRDRSNFTEDGEDRPVRTRRYLD